MHVKGLTTAKMQENMFHRYMEFLQRRYSCTGQEIYLNELHLVKSQYEIVLEENLQRLIFHSKAKYQGEGERNTKYFFSLAKSRYNNKVMLEIKNPSGQTITTPEGVLQIQFNYYKNLYTALKCLINFSF